MFDIINSFSKNYDLKAIYAPTSVLVMPFIAVALAFLDYQSIMSYLGLSFIFAPSVFMLKNYVRFKGKTRDEDVKRPLYESRFMPSVYALSFESKIVDDHIKEECKKILSHKMADISFPSSQESETLQGVASYEKASKWLIGQTRDKDKFEILFKSNIDYGFTRNLFGVKNQFIAITIMCMAILICSLIFDKELTDVVSQEALTVVRINPYQRGISLFFLIIQMSIYCTTINKKQLQRVADQYAESLMNTCFMLDDRPKTNRQSAILP